MLLVPHCGSADDVRSCSAVAAATRPQRVSAVRRRASRISRCLWRTDTRAWVCATSGQVKMVPWGPLLRMGLEPRRLASGAVLGVVIGLISLLPLASEEGPKAVGYAGVALMVVPTAPWILSGLLPAHRARTSRTRRASGPEARVARILIEVRLQRSLRTRVAGPLRRRPSEDRRAARPFLANAVVLLPRSDSALYGVLRRGEPLVPRSPESPVR